MSILSVLENTLKRRLYLLPYFEHRVRTNDNQWGTVKWMYSTQGMVGLKLDKWNPNATDGYDKVSPEGKGYFVKYAQCVENVGVIDWTDVHVPIYTDGMFVFLLTDAK